MVSMYRMNLTRGAVLLFTAAVVFSPWYAPAMYSPVHQVISELAAQNTPGHRVMAFALVLVGLAIAADGLLGRDRGHLLSWPAVPFVVFGLCFAAAGLFGHKPYVGALPWNPAAHAMHAILTSASGSALAVGLAWQAWCARSPVYRWWTATLSLVSVAFPLLMVAFPSMQGVIQRSMYALVFWGWFWPFHPLSSQD